jgi:hypothetical protein
MAVPYGPGRPAGSPTSPTAGEEGKTRLATLIETGFFARTGPALRLTVPVFTAAEDAALAPVADRIAREIAAQSRQPGHDNLDALLDRLGFGGLRGQYVAMKGWLGGETMVRCMAAMVGMGLLGEPPARVAGTWGYWVWRGKLRLMAVN